MRKYPSLLSHNTKWMKIYEMCCIMNNAIVDRNEDDDSERWWSPGAA